MLLHNLITLLLPVAKYRSHYKFYSETNRGPLSLSLLPRLGPFPGPLRPLQHFREQPGDRRDGTNRAVRLSYLSSPLPPSHQGVLLPGSQQPIQATSLQRLYSYVQTDRARSCVRRPGTADADATSACG